MKQELSESMQKLIELKDLVYAPLQAVSLANIQLSSNIVDFLSATGDTSTDQLGKTTISLRTLQMLYESVKNDADDNAVSDSISLEVPLLSIFPLSTMKVSRSKINFSTQVKDIQTVNGQPKILAEITGGNDRRTANTPKINFEVELEGVQVAEGLARFVDTLNANVIPKQLARRPLDEKGNKLTGGDLERYERQMEISRKKRQLKAHIAETDEMIRAKNNELKLETGMEYEEFIQIADRAEFSQAANKAADDIGEYMEIKSGFERNLEQLRAKQLKERFENSKDRGDRHEQQRQEKRY